jgi:hypothetical protein
MMGGWIVNVILGLANGPSQRSILIAICLVTLVTFW